MTELATMVATLGLKPTDTVVIFQTTVGGRHRQTFVSVADLGGIDTEGWNTWACFNPLKPGGTERKAGHLDRVVALVADLDRKPTGLRDDETITTVVERISEVLGQGPSVVVDSGHGVQPYWRMNGDDVAKAAELLVRFGLLVRAVAAELGGTVDTTWTPERVWRAPGTMNLKGDPVLARLVHVEDLPPLTIDDVAKRLEVAGVRELKPGAVRISREPVSSPDNWSYGDRTCAYVVKMITGWSTDVPASRHGWLLSGLTRLHCAHRLGCITEDDHRQAVDALEDRLEHLVATTEPVRTVGVYEIAGADLWALARACSENDDEAREELGDHEHGAGRGFFDARPSLSALRQLAHSRMANPWAVLGEVITTVLAYVPVSVTTPEIFGTASLNFIVASVAGSGGGKQLAEGAARDLVTISREGRSKFEAGPIEKTVGSGEGIIASYLRWNAATDSYVQEHDSVRFRASEISGVNATAARQGSTVLTFLKQAYSGELLETNNADVKRHRSVPAGRYRFTLVMGVQPRHADKLLSDDGGGMPERIVWLPADGDETLPDEDVDETELLIILPSHTGPLGIDPDIRAEVRQARRLRQQGKAAPNGHDVLARIKIACALALIDGRTAVTVEDWHLADLVMDVSARTRRRIELELGRSHGEKRAERITTAAKSALASEEALHQQKISRGVQAARRHLEKHHATGERCATKHMRKGLDPSLRQHLDEIDETGVKAGLFVTESTEYHGQTGRVWRLP